MKFIIYLHGFNSSPSSEKACLTKEFFQTRQVKINETHAVKGDALNVVIPNLPPSPLDAVAKVNDLIQELGIENVAGFIGSSLGGYLSLYFQHQFAQMDRKIKVVLINPAIKPYELLIDYLGDNQNPYTGERYSVEMSHMEDLRSLAVKTSARADNTFLLVQAGDEVLDFKQSVAALAKAKMWVQPKGNHAFLYFVRTLPAIYSFFQSTKSDL